MNRADIENRPRLHRVGSFYLSPRAHLALVISITAAATLGVSMYAGPDAQRTADNTTIPMIREGAAATSTPIPVDLRAVILKNTQPGTPLQAALEDMHYLDGDDATFYDCTHDGTTSIEEHVERTVTQRKAPSRLRGEKIIELKPSEAIIKSPIDVAIEGVGGREANIPHWSAQVIGEGLGFIARKQAYTNYLLGSIPTCSKIEGIDYLRYIQQPPSKVQK